MPIAHQCLVLVVTLVWGFNFVVIRWGTEHMDALTMTALRFFFTAVPLVFFLPRPTLPMRFVALYGLMFGMGFWGMVNVAVGLGVPSGMASLLLQLSVFLSVITGALVFQEPIATLKKIGIALAFVGFMVLVVGMNVTTPAMGVVFIFVAAIFWTLCNALIKAKQPAGALRFVAWSSLFVPVPMMIVAMVQQYATTGSIAFDASLVFSIEGWLAVAFQAVAATIFGYGAWTMLIAKYGLAKVTPYTLLVPIFGLAFGALIYGERLALLEIVGATLVIAGLVMLSIRLPNTGSTKS